MVENSSAFQSLNINYNNRCGVVAAIGQRLTISTTVVTSVNLGKLIWENELVDFPALERQNGASSSPSLNAQRIQEKYDTEYVLRLLRPFH